MTQSTHSPAPSPGRFPGTDQTRAVGIKLIIVGALAVLMWVPALFIYALTWKRSSTADSVRSEIYQRAGGEQRLAGPFLIVPATEQIGGYAPRDVEGTDTRTADTRTYARRTFVILPETLNAETALETETRSRSIYDATVYTADLSLSGRFDLTALEVPPKTTLQWHEARLVIATNGTSLTGIQGTPQLSLDGRNHRADFEAGYTILNGSTASPARSNGNGLSTPVRLTQDKDSLAFTLALTMTGGGSIGIAPLGDDTRLTMTGDWPHPGFQGQLATSNAQIDAEGFTANWQSSYLARAMPGFTAADEETTWRLLNQMAVTELVNPGSPYQKVDRSLKYALLFMGLIFLTVFILEVAFKSRAHPAQYILIGMAQVLFYVMVLALSEHIAFDLAFAIMSALTVLLSGFYAGSIFRRASAAIIAMLAFSGVYGLIWLLMKSEDFALLIGASAAFTALAVTMFVTRNIDWYGESRSQAPDPAAG